MNLFEVYPLLPITLEKGEGCYVYDSTGKKYLDLYGGHAVISIGHSHPHYIDALTRQIKELGYYSNSVHIPLQKKWASKLEELSGCKDYQLFMVNSGAEAVENALKVASFVTGKKKFIAFKNSFHGRTNGTLSVTDNAKIRPAMVDDHNTYWLDLNDTNGVKEHLSHGDVAAVIVEGIQGIGGLDEPDPDFLKQVEVLCKRYEALLILDEVQSGSGRTGDYFAHQKSGVKPDLIPIAKGIGNGFPVGGLLVQNHIKPEFGMLGTTFGGNHLGCSAALAVLETIEKEHLMENAAVVGTYLKNQLENHGMHVKGRGLMLGIDFGFPIKELRRDLIEAGILSGTSKNPNLIRILPPLNLSKEQADYFVETLVNTLNAKPYHETVHLSS